MSRTLPRAILLIVSFALIGVACSGPAAPGDEVTTSVLQELTPGAPLAGAPLYQGVCATCHGADLGGVEGLGPALWPSEFVAIQPEEALISLIITGRPADDPDTVTGVAMVPRGGNPSLSDLDIANIVAYIKGQQR